MLKTAFTALLIAGVPVAASAAPFVNGDFENGLTGWSISNAVSAHAGSVYADGIGTSATPAQRANTYVFFGGGNVTSTNTLVQTFSTVAGKTYNFSFEAVDVGAGAQDVDFNFGVTSGTTGLAQANDFSLFQTYTGSFVANGPTTTVSFTNSSFADGTDVALDNVTITTDVPEASTWAMMIAGFGLVGAATRRHRTLLAA